MTHQDRIWKRWLLVKAPAKDDDEVVTGLALAKGPRFIFGCVSGNKGHVGSTVPYDALLDRGLALSAESEQARHSGSREIERLAPLDRQVRPSASEDPAGTLLVQAMRGGENTGRAVPRDSGSSANEIASNRRCTCRRRTRQSNNRIGSGGRAPVDVHIQAILILLECRRSYAARLRSRSQREVRSRVERSRPNVNRQRPWRQGHVPWATGDHAAHAPVLSLDDHDQVGIRVDGQLVQSLGAVEG
jgi:hypothetical protein